MGMETLSKNVDRGLYKDAVNWSGPEGQKTDPITYFTHIAAKEGIGPDSRALEKREGHYLRKYHVPEFAVNRQSKVKDFARKSWYVEAFFKDHGIAVRGPEAATVGKAFSVSSVQALFPVFYDTMIVAGLLAQPLLDRLTAETVQVNSGSADHVVMNENTWERSTGQIGEWTRFPEMSISATNAPVTLKKWGGILKASDEAIRRARLPIFARGLERIGRQLANDLTDFALDVLLLGDGNTGTPLVGSGDIQPAAVTGSPVYSDLVALLMLFNVGYAPTDLIATRESWTDLLNMAEFKDPLAGFRFQATGVPPTPMGLNLWRWDSLASSGWATTKLLMLQADAALVQYQEGGITSESDRIINGQWQEVATSIYTAFAILDRDARKVATGW
jgi:hypothetical protein